MSLLRIPRKTKYTSNHLYKLKNIPKAIKLDYGDWGIVAYESGIITPNQIEAARLCIVKYIKTQGKMWTKLLPNHIISKKPKDSRMGAGKGKLFKFVFVLHPGDVIFEATTLPVELIVKIFQLVTKKISTKLKLLVKKK